ncbi:hypothetical protein [Klenkia taihuensis]|uniref:DNA-directed RNA polymerase specialized sigma subunit, sigma24 family n=1 Tax=Klenkia taihuensis TaxID=1225127 RepID=A0A1I1PC74_9ACTN|nr:hypothetical protein [Klenkia taihuensis]GHE11464.1 hypothetical protein GCM10011381_24890 [Klenkia taihuensis]SFD04613.1 hypothetical protein SAMN05661030_2407 [Klenkia taihuensis]
MDVAGTVREHREALLGPAFLLTGDERLAEDRVDRALARLAPGADHATAVAALVRTRAPRGAVVPAGPDPWWVGADELAAARATAAVLAGLDDAARAALVLHHEGAPADPAALARGRAALIRGVDPGPSSLTSSGAGGRTPAQEDAVARALDGLLAVRRPPARDDVAAVPLVRAHRRSRCTRPLLAVVGLVAVALLAVLVPGPAPTAPRGRFDGPTRGSLAGDEAVRDALLAAPAEGPATGRRELVLAGELLDRRWALVAGRTDRGWTGWWSAGPADGPLSPVAGPVALPPDRPAALQLDDVLVVVAEPDEPVQVSTGLVVRADGSAGRDPVALPLEDGVGVLRLAAPDPGGVAVQVRAGVSALPVPVARAGDADARPAVPPLVPLRGGDADLGARTAAVDAALGAVAAPTGQDPATLTPQLLWAGALPGPRGGGVDAAVLVVPQPSGAVVVSTAWAARLGDGSLQTIGCGTQGFPSGTDPAGLVVAVRCVVAERGTGAARATVLLTAPTGTVQLPDDRRDTGRVADPAAGSSVPVGSAGPGDLLAG